MTTKSPDGWSLGSSMNIDYIREKTVGRPNLTCHGGEFMSQEQEDKEDLDAYRERIRRIIEEDRDILDELA